MGCGGSKVSRPLTDDQEAKVIDDWVKKLVKKSPIGTVGCKICHSLKVDGLLDEAWRVLVSQHLAAHHLPKMGILQTERAVRPPAMSDITTTNSYLYEMSDVLVKGLSYEQVLRGDPLDEEQQKAVEQAVRKLEKEGVLAIGGDMGSLYAYQGMIAKLTNIPVALSALIQAPFLAAVYQPSEKILVLTTDSVHFTEERLKSTLTSCGVRDDDLARFVLQGAQDIDCFSCEAIATGSTIDPQRVGSHLARRLQKAKTADPSIKAVLIESEMFPMFSDAIRKVLHCGVFDNVTLLDFIHMSRTDNPRFGIEFGTTNRPPARIEKALLAKMGILRIDYTYPPAMGDAAHPESYEYYTYHAHVKGLTFEAVQKGDPLTSKQRSSMKKAIGTLEGRQGVMGIAGDCGFLINYQKDALSMAKRVPMFISAMLQAPILASLFAHHELILVLTANGPALRPAMSKILTATHVPESEHHRFHVAGCENLPGFEAVALGLKVDTEKVQPHVVTLVEAFKRRNPDLRAVLLECTELPPYADAIRHATGMMVLDAITIVDYFHSAVSQNPCYGIDWERLARWQESSTESASLVSP